jgi:hypothetical protein
MKNTAKMPAIIIKTTSLFILGISHYAIKNYGQHQGDAARKWFTMFNLSTLPLSEAENADVKKRSGVPALLRI